MHSLSNKEIVSVSGGVIGGGGANDYLRPLEVGATGMGGTGYSGVDGIANPVGCGAAVRQGESSGANFCGGVGGPICPMIDGAYAALTNTACTTGWTGGEGRTLQSYNGTSSTTPSNSEFDDWSL